MQWLTDPEIWIAFLTLTTLEIVLGIDNLVFISILAGKLPKDQQERASRIGLGLAMFMRIGLLFSISWIFGLEETLFTLLNVGFTGHDLILIVGGLFLIGKSTTEIHDKLEGEEGHAVTASKNTFGSVIIQIMLLDIVFSPNPVKRRYPTACSGGLMFCGIVFQV